MEDSTKVSRQQLYEEVWADPVTIVAKRYGLSDVGLAKICRKLKIPLPGLGYWSKLRAGKLVLKGQLPDVAEASLPPVRLHTVEPIKQQARETAQQKAFAYRKTVGTISVPDEMTDPHPLIRAAAKRLKRRDGWTDPKGLRTAPNEVLNLNVTSSSLDRALRIMDTLIKNLARASVTVRIDTQAQQTILDVGGTAVTLALTEHVRRTPHRITPAEQMARGRRRHDYRSAPDFGYFMLPRFDYHATGALTITVGRRPSRSWNDTERARLEDRLGKVVAGILALADEIRAQKEEERRRSEEHARAQNRYEHLVNHLKSEEAAFQALEQEATKWERATRLRAYIRAAEKNTQEMGTISSQLQDWLAWARAKADWLDPFVLICDAILDAPEPKPPHHWLGIRFVSDGR